MANGPSSPFPQDATWTDTYLLVLGIFTAANVVVFILDAALWQGSSIVVAYYNNLVDYFGGAAPFSILIAALVTAAWRSYMLKSERIRQYIFERGREKEREEQKVENRAWYERQQAALKRGEEFDEPPPWERR